MGRSGRLGARPTAAPCASVLGLRWAPMVGWIAVVGLVLGSGVVSSEPARPQPEPIVNGSDAGVCDFPAAVSVLNAGGQQFCTAALVHPRVVMLAGHCIASQSPATIGFGETVSTPAVQTPVADCGVHPQFEWLDQLLPMDLAYCTLQEDAPPVPTTPPLMGCEAEQLVPEAEVTLVGFGFDDELGTSGNTMKRWTVNTLEFVDEEANDLYLLGVDDASACFGDSGGPAYMQLADGSWRLVGITSEAHPDAGGQPPYCGYGVIYELVHLQMPWLEEATGFDVTPCFDADGTWSPDETCGGFPNALTSDAGWAGSCGTKDVSGDSQTCGDPFGVSGTSTGGDPGDGSSTGEGGDSTGPVGGGTAGSSSGGGSSSSSTGSATAPSGSTSSGGGLDVQDDTSSGASGAGQGSGCGCRSGGDGTAWLLGALLVLATRRRRESASRGR